MLVQVMLVQVMQNFSNVNEDDVNQGISTEVVEKGEKVSKRELCLRG